MRSTLENISLLPVRIWCPTLLRMMIVRMTVRSARALYLETSNSSFSNADN